MKLPPYADVLGATVLRDAPGMSDAPGQPPVLVMPFAIDVVGRPGFLHGGAIAGFLEMAAIAALRHALMTAGEAEARIKPINVTIDFMRGGRDKPTYASGTVTRLGNRIANVGAVAWQDDRANPIAAARMNYLIVRD